MVENGDSDAYLESENESGISDSDSEPEIPNSVQNWDGKKRSRSGSFEPAQQSGSKRWTKRTSLKKKVLKCPLLLNIKAHIEHLIPVSDLQLH